MDTFGKRLVKVRKEKNLTQKKLAELLGVTPTRLNYWEKDKRKPDIEMTKKISEVLNVETDFLIGRNFWTDDMYEDYKNASNPADKYYLLTKYGVPDSLKSDYRRFQTLLQASDDNQFILTEDEENLILETRKLNDFGKKHLMEYVDLLLASPKHKDAPVPTHLMPVAAHNDHADNPEELERMKRDLEKL